MAELPDSILEKIATSAASVMVSEIYPLPSAPNKREEIITSPKDEAIANSLDDNVEINSFLSLMYLLQSEQNHLLLHPIDEYEQIE